MSKDLWLLELERILDGYADDTIEEEEARARLKGLGLDRDEIDEHLWAAKS